MSNDFSPSQASPDLAESYRLRLLDYREQHHKVRRLMSRVSVRPEVVLAADRVRNSIHQDLRRLAKDLGKSSADVDIDILSTADDLTEYQLPSFKLMQPWETLDSPRLSFVTNTDELHVQTQTPNSRTNEETIAQTEMFIPFGEQAAYHLFDRDQFFERSLQEPQRRRSAQKAQELLHGLGKYVEFSTQETFHRWVRFFLESPAQKTSLSRFWTDSLNMPLKSRSIRTIFRLRYVTWISCAFFRTILRRSFRMISMNMKVTNISCGTM